MRVLLYISCIISEHPFIKTPMGGCFCTWPSRNIRNEIYDFKIELVSLYGSWQPNVDPNLADPLQINYYLKCVIYCVYL